MSIRTAFTPSMRLASRSLFYGRPTFHGPHPIIRQPLNRLIIPRRPRHLTTSSTTKPKRTIRSSTAALFRDSPFQFSLALFIIATALGFCVYTLHFYRTYIIGAYHNYPESVAKELRKAVYYMKTDLQPNDALKYFKRALEACEKEMMDPMSDEVMGIKIEVSRLMEIVLRLDKAVEVLERVRVDCMNWLEHGTDRESDRKKRTRVLKRTVAVHVKLAELYANAAVWDRKAAEERLVWAVETVYRERQRRQAEGVKDEEEGEWMSDDEVGATAERLAERYAEQGQHYLAVPLYLQALQFKPTTDCHSVTLMSNMASSLAQQSPRAAREIQAFSQSRNVQNQAPAIGPMATREKMIQDAREWAQKALEVARGLKPPVRTEECDVGCVVATHNLGELAELLGERGEARRQYEEAVQLAKAIGFSEGVENGNARLTDLGTT